MKKVLFATTALVAVGGMAAADVSLSGGGRLGLVFIENNAVGGQDVRIEKRMTINIDGSGETDSGLSFGGRIRLRSDEGDASGAASSANIYLGTDTWRVTAGNTSGAAVYRMPYFAGSIGLDGNGYSNVAFNIGNTAWYMDSYSSRGNAGQVVRLDFSFGGFGVSLSTSDTADRTRLGDSEENGIAASYNFGDWKVAASFTANASGSNDAASLGITGSIGDFGVGFVVHDLENVGTKAVLSGSYSFASGTTVAAFVANTDEDTAGSAGIAGRVGGSSDTEFGLGFTHSLGGATLAGGISSNWQEATRASIGVRFKF